MISTRVATEKATSAGVEPIQPKPPTTGRPPKRAANPAISSGTKTRKPHAAASPRPIRMLVRSSTGSLSIPPVANSRHDRDDKPSGSHATARAAPSLHRVGRVAARPGAAGEADHPRPPLG